MIELFGFWGNVSVITLTLISMPLFLLYWALFFAVGQVTQDDEVTKRFMGSIAKEFPRENNTRLFKWKINTVIPVCFVVGSLLVWIIIGFAYLDTKHSVITMVSAVSQVAAASTGWLVFVVLIYLLFIGVLRKLYKTAVKVNSLVSKLK